MTEVDDQLLREIGRAVTERSRGKPGPKGYLLSPSPLAGKSEGDFKCPACGGLHPKSGGAGHKYDCPLKEVM